jgi:hypothetical protein
MPAIKELLLQPPTLAASCDETVAKLLDLAKRYG